MRTVPPAHRRVAGFVLPALVIGVLLLSGAGPAHAPVLVGTPQAPAGSPFTPAAAHLPLAGHPATFPQIWSQLSVPGPGPRSYYGSAWDPAIGGLLIFGGCVAGAPWGESTFCGAMTNETWALVGNQWENLTSPMGPSPRVLPMMAYDPTEDGVLLFGGGTGPLNSNCVTDTWLYGGAGWQELRPSTVPGCAQTGMDFDGNLGHILLLASASGTDDSAIENVSWEFENGTWVQLAATSSFDRSSPMMMYDSTDRETVLFGGFDLSCGCQNLADTWVFRQGAWTEIYPAQSPGARNEAGIADDPVRGGLLMFGGHYAYVYYNDTWLFHNGSWTLLNTPVAPTYRWAMQMDLDPLTDQEILFGGYNFTNSNPQFTNETWIYGYPSPITAAALTIEPTTIAVGQETALSAGESGGLGALTYVYFGLPPGCASANSSLLLCIPSSTGLFEVQVNVSDQLGRYMTANANFSVTPAVVPAPLSLTEFLAAPSMITEGASLTVAIVTSGGSGGNAYTYTGLPPGCSSVDAASLVCVPTEAGAFDVQATVKDSAGASVVGSGTITVQNPPPPPPGPTVVRLTAYPDPATVGQLMAFEVQTTGGDGTLSFAYTGLPSGCSPQNSSVLLCTPTSVGAATVTVSVTDALGRTSEGDATVTVAAAHPSAGNASSTGTQGGASSVVFSYLDLALVAVAVAAGIVAVVATLRGRRGPPPPPPTAGPG